MYKFYWLLDAAVVAAIGFYLVLAPYTKVEESFNLQAVHDILNYGPLPSQTITDNYDHIKFPGVVPRTFVGSLILAAIVNSVNSFSRSILAVDLLAPEKSQSNLQLLVRAILGLANAFGFYKIRESINRVTITDKKSKTKGVIGFWFTVLLLTQFHILFYSTRTLPNFIALPFVSIGLSRLIEGDIVGYAWLAFTGIVFRLEVGLFAVIIAIVSSLGFGQSSIFVNGLSLFTGTSLGGLISLGVDSHFWGRLVVPEIESFVFNVVEGKASEWGVEPWSAYFGKYLFQLFRPPVILLLVLPGLSSDPADDGVTFVDQAQKKKVAHPARHSLRILFVSSVLYIAAMSFQPHKEWRFIIYTIPILTLQAANGLTGISRKWSLGLTSKLLLLIIIALSFLASLLSLLSGYVSHFNYPGGEALAFVNEYVQPLSSEEVFVHLDVPACMTGVSRFGQIHSDLITYDKTEDATELSEIWSQIDILVTGVSPAEIDKNFWELLHSTKAFYSMSVQPIIQLLQRQQTDKTAVRSFAVTVGKEAIRGDFSTIHTFVRSLLLTTDYIFVYKRVQPDPKSSNIEEVPSAIEDIANGTGTIAGVSSEANEELASESIEVSEVEELEVVEEILEPSLEIVDPENTIETEQDSTIEEVSGA
ncbi:hypothetical protein G9P44_003317 [Scheffersomyces stipitis]|nr:hypothetical protein G9P44_003317 [Scheffersomyces stipitis]